MGKVLSFILVIVVGALCVYEIVSLIRTIVDKRKEKNKIEQEQKDNGNDNIR